jgi:hypothetical protein
MGRSLVQKVTVERGTTTIVCRCGWKRSAENTIAARRLHGTHVTDECPIGKR